MAFILEINDSGPGFGPDLKELVRVIRFVADCVERSSSAVESSPHGRTLSAIVRDSEGYDAAAWVYAKAEGVFGVYDLVAELQAKSGEPFTLSELDENGSGGSDAETKKGEA